MMNVIKAAMYATRRFDLLHIALFLFYWAGLPVRAFSIIRQPLLDGITGVPYHRSTHPTVQRGSPLRNNNNNNNNNSDDDANGSNRSPLSSGASSALELTSTLARLDREWRILQQNRKSRSRWTKLILNGSDKTTKSSDNNNIIDGNETSYAREENAGTGGTSSSESQSQSIRSEEFAYLLEPPCNIIPSCLIVFVGGAGLGTYPQIAYNELLLRISNRLNAAVLTAPYNVGLDHFALAKQAGEITRKAILHCEDDSSRLYPKTLPTYCLAHSLGCKLATIYMAATGQDFNGVGLISYNNFSFGQTVGMVKVFAQQIRRNTSNSNQPENGKGSWYETIRNSEDQLLDQVFSFAETAVAAVGVDFSPNPAEMERLIQLKYDNDRQIKTRLFCFDDDKLDCSSGFVRSCIGDGPTLSELHGTHLTPVYFKVGLDQLEDFPDEARSMTREALGGFESASFGNEVELDALVDEICSWIMGKDPSRRPTSKALQAGKPQIAGGAGARVLQDDN